MNIYNRVTIAKWRTRLRMLMGLVFSSMPLSLYGFYGEYGADPSVPSTGTYTHAQATRMGASNDENDGTRIGDFVIQNEGTSYMFQESQVAIFIRENYLKDTGSDYGNKSQHCDSDKINDCTNLINDAVNNATNKYLSGDLSGGNKEVVKGLHALQDFYTHTNWGVKNESLT